MATLALLIPGTPAGEPITTSEQSANQHVFRAMAAQTRSLRQDNRETMDFRWRERCDVFCAWEWFNDSSEPSDAGPELPAGSSSPGHLSWPRLGWATAGHQPAWAARRQASKRWHSSAKEEGPQVVVLHESQASRGRFSKEKNKLIGFVCWKEKPESQITDPSPSPSARDIRKGGSQLGWLILHSYDICSVGNGF